MLKISLLSEIFNKMSQSLIAVGERKIVFISGMPDPAAAGEIAFVKTTDKMTRMMGNEIQIK